MTAPRSACCTRCEGEGEVLVLGRPGRFRVDLEAFEPSERFERCTRCDGSGVVTLCPHCGAPEVECACPAAHAA